jgi:HAD superfamily hydrolase (TIGR01509 family)
LSLSASARAVIFDLDGVLVDSGAHHRDAWLALLTELEIVPSNDFWRQTIGRPAEEAVALLLGRPVEPAEALELAERKRAHYARLRRRGVMVVSGVLDFVDELTRRDIPHAVATSASRRECDALLDATALRPRFDVVVTADDVRWGKPNPEIYLRAAEKLALPPGGCLVFEDSLVGIHAARNAGMRVIGVTTAHTGRELIGAGAERAIAHFEGFAWPM